MTSRVGKIIKNAPPDSTGHPEVSYFVKRSSLAEGSHKILRHFVPQDEPLSGKKSSEFTGIVIEILIARDPCGGSIFFENS